MPGFVSYFGSTFHRDVPTGGRYAAPLFRRLWSPESGGSSIAGKYKTGRGIQPKGLNTS